MFKFIKIKNLKLPLILKYFIDDLKENLFIIIPLIIGILIGYLLTNEIISIYHCFK